MGIAGAFSSSVGVAIAATAIAQSDVAKLVTKSAGVPHDESMRPRTRVVKITGTAKKNIGIVRKTYNISRFPRAACRIKVSAAKKIH